MVCLAGHIILRANSIKNLLIYDIFYKATIFRLYNTSLVCLYFAMLELKPICYPGAPPPTTFLAQKPSLFLTVVVLLFIYSLIYSFNLYFAYSSTISEERRRNSPVDDDNAFSQDVLLSSQMS